VVLGGIIFSRGDGVIDYHLESRESPDSGVKVDNDITSPMKQTAAEDYEYKDEVISKKYNHRQ